MRIFAIQVEGQGQAYERPGREGRVNGGDQGVNLFSAGGAPQSYSGGGAVGLNQRGVWRAFWAFVTSDKSLKQAGRAPEVHLPSGLGVGELSLRVLEHFDGQILSTLMLRLDPRTSPTHGFVRWLRIRG